MQRHRSHVSGVILKGTLASSQHRNRTFKPLQKLRKSRNFALCLIDDFVFSKLFYTLFFVAILLIFNQFYKVTKYSAEKATEGLVQQAFCKIAGSVLFQKHLCLIKVQDFLETLVLKARNLAKRWDVVRNIRSAVSKRNFGLKNQNFDLNLNF